MCSNGVEVCVRLMEVMEDESDTDTLDDIYEVEKILDAKRKDGKMHYKVRWEGYGSEEDSWEPLDNLLTCQELVDRYWEERKEGYKKRGRKPKRLKEMTEDESDTSDTEEGRKDQNDEESDMPLQPQKRKRGRPPKQRILSDVDVEKQSLDRGSSSSPELSEENAAKKRRRQANKDDEFSSMMSAKFLLLGCDVAPLGMTRQASKELALVSLRKKQGCETATSSTLEVRTATEHDASSLERKQEFLVESEPRETASDSVELKDNFEVIEISSQSTENEGELNSSQESEPVMKEYIEITSHSESEREEEGTKPAEDSSKTKLKKRNKRENLLTVDAEKDKIDKWEDDVGPKKEFSKLKRRYSVEDHAKKNDKYSSGHTNDPIDFSFESNSAISEVEFERTSFVNTKKNPETSKMNDFNAHGTDENSNQVASSGFPRSSLTSKLSMSRIRALKSFQKSAQERNSGILGKNTSSDSEGKNTDLPGRTGISDSNVTVTSVSALKNSSTQILVVTSESARDVFESNANRRINNDMENSVTRTASLAMDTSQEGSQDGIITAKRRSKIGGQKSVHGKARRTDGRPKSVREIKKRLSVDSSLGTQQNFAASTKSPLSENLTVGMNEALGKPEKQLIASTTAELLPKQCKPSSLPLMDGDLIGAIIQGSGKIDESKAKPQTGAPQSQKKNNAQDEAEKFKPWDSGMEDISDGEDDLSDFEFDLDDYSPHSFFNDVEESNVNERTASPVVEPLNLSLAALKQAIREGDIMQVRRALAVPGFNPDTIDTASGMSLLMWAATYGQDDIVKLLLRRGAGVNYTDLKRNAVTALMQAAEQGFPETVQILLESGAHINCQTTAGETALMRACKKGHKNVVEALLRHGVDTKAQSTHELTAVQIALKNQHFEIQNLLSDHEESMASTLQIALGKCLGTAGTLRLPLLMPYRCIAPGEKEGVTFMIKYNANKVPEGSKVVLFCVRVDFNGDEVCLSFGGDNGIRSILFNSSIQYPLVQGNRSVYLLTLDTEVSSNELTVQTHPVKNAKLIVCVANVSAAAATATTESS